MRSEFPDTHGLYASPQGFPLIEILSDGNGINVKTQPAGGREITALQQGERAAFQLQESEYFFGAAAAAALRATLGILHPVARDPGGDQAYYDRVDAENAREAALCESVLSSGAYVTPAPPIAPVASKVATPATPSVNAATGAQTTPGDAPIAEPHAEEPSPPIPLIVTDPDTRQPHERGASEPGYRPLPPVEAETQPQHHVDRLHSLIDQAERDLGAAGSWIAREMRALLHHLGATRSE